MKKKSSRKNKNKLPILDFDHDFLQAFENTQENSSDGHAPDSMEFFENSQQSPHEGISTNPDSMGRTFADHTEEENFADLLEEYSRKGRSRPVKKASPMPVEKRLKRYPGVECELDLHGYNAIGAQVRAGSFIHSCKQQGFFTIRIIVGKGLHSDGGPVLPDVVEDVLKEMKKQEIVIGYKWDRIKKSKSGSVVIYLKHFERFD